MVNNLKRIVSLLFLCVVSSSFGMQTTSQLVLSHLNSVVSVAPMLPFWIDAYEDVRKYKISQQDDHECYYCELDVPEEVADFVHQVLKDRGIQDADSIKVKDMCCAGDPINAEYFPGKINVSVDYSYVEIDGKRQFLKKNFLDQDVVSYDENGQDNVISDEDSFVEISDEEFLRLMEGNATVVLNLSDALRFKTKIIELIADGNQPSKENLEIVLNKIEQNLDDWRGTIQHEAGHYVHKMSHYLTGATLIVPSLTSIALSACRNGLDKIIGSLSLRAKFLCSPFLYGGTALLTYVASKYLVTAYERHHERLADAFVESNPRILQACKNSFQRWEKESKKYSNCDSCGHKNLFSRMSCKFNRNQHFSTHPSHAERIKTLDRRLVDIEKIRLLTDL